MKIDVKMRLARTQDLEACAGILNSWIDETDWMPRIHPAADVVRHYRDIVYRDRKLFVVAAEERVVGMMALAKDQTVTALYVKNGFRNQGVGHLLIAAAKREYPDHLQLWTFQKNIQARRFCQREGFVEINRTDGDNEENLPDVLMEWRG